MLLYRCLGGVLQPQPGPMAGAATTTGATVEAPLASGDRAAPASAALGATAAACGACFCLLMLCGGLAFAHLRAKPSGCRGAVAGPPAMSKATEEQPCGEA